MTITVHDLLFLNEEGLTSRVGNRPLKIDDTVFIPGINGVDVATRYYGWDYNAVPTLPGVNEVLILSNGVVLCNAADAGKTLTATYNYLRHPS